MNYEISSIKKPNQLKEFFQKLFSKIEDVFFEIILKLPERLIPEWLMNYLERYTTKRLNQLKQDNIKHTWRNMYLQSAVEEISNRQKEEKNNTFR